MNSLINTCRGTQPLTPQVWIVCFYLHWIWHTTSQLTNSLNPNTYWSYQPQLLWPRHSYPIEFTCREYFVFLNEKINTGNRLLWQHIYQLPKDMNILPLFPCQPIQNQFLLVMSHTAIICYYKYGTHGGAQMNGHCLFDPWSVHI